MTSPEGVMPASATTSDASVMDDIIEIFYAPSRVFARRRDNPKFWAAFFILSILFAIGIWVMMRNYADVLDVQIRRQMETAMAKNPQMTAEQAETGRRMGQTFAPIAGVFMGVISTLLLGLGVWVVGKLFESKADLRHGMMIATFASFPKLIDLVIGAVMALVMGTAGMTNMMAAGPSLARFAPTGTSNAVIALLARFSIGTIWATILIAIGLHVAGRMAKGRAYIAAIVLWLIATGLGVFSALRQG